MVELAGWLGNLLLSVCAIPLAIAAWRTKRVDIDPIFLYTWISGEVLGMVYAVSLGAWPIICNFTINLVCLAIVTYYRR